MPPLIEAARQLAMEGLGWEDIQHKLRDRGISRFQARCAVFGNGAARRMEIRDVMRGRQLEKAS